MRSSSLAAGAAVFAVAVLGSAPAMADSAVADSTATTPMCATSQLTGSLGGSDAAAGSLYRYLVLTNHSARPVTSPATPACRCSTRAGSRSGSPPPGSP